MNVRPSILCPIDYSEASAGALQYAVALADHFATRLIVLRVDNPLPIASMDFGTGLQWSHEGAERELAVFVADACEHEAAVLAMCEQQVVVGKPGAEILRVARERSCDLIVMSSHGVTGARKLLFGSTTERVLRETPIPVLVTPPLNPGRIRVENATQLIGRIVVPVDLSPASVHQAGVAAALAVALGLPVVFVHVLEAARRLGAARLDVGDVETERTETAKDELDALVSTVSRQVTPETLIVAGDPAEEAAKLVRDRHAGLVVMALHGSPHGRRIGSVTYRMLCLCTALVLALPSKSVAPQQKHAASGADRSALGGTAR